VPPNVKFIVDDVEEPWADPLPFDFIQCRYMAGSIKDWHGHVKRIFDHLKPGGWVELSEYDIILKSQDNTIPKDYKPQEMLLFLNTACEKVGRPLGLGPKLKGWVEEAGFVNVGHGIVPLPLGIWPKDKTLVSSHHPFTLLVRLSRGSRTCGKMLIYGDVEGDGCFHDAAVYGRRGWLHKASLYDHFGVDPAGGGCVQCES
jgi:hypothetical protein